MSDNYFFINDNGKGDEVLGYFFFLLFFLIPLLPGGDIGLYFAKQISNEPMVILNIIFWIAFIGIYAAFLFFIFANFLGSLNGWMIVFLIYLQGILFSFLINDTELSNLSSITVKVISSVFNFIISPA